MANEAPPSQSGLTGQKWVLCSVCGFRWPENELVDQRGGKACPGCLDEDGVKENRIDITK